MSAVKICREIALIKAQVEDVELRKQLIAPLEADLRALVVLQQRQGVLPLEGATESAKPGAVKK